MESCQGSNRDAARNYWTLKMYEAIHFIFKCNKVHFLTSKSLKMSYLNLLCLFICQNVRISVNSLISETEFIFKRFFHFKIILNEKRT